MTKKVKTISLIITFFIFIIALLSIYTLLIANAEDQPKPTDVFTMSVGTKQENYSFPSKYGTETPVGKSDSGIAFFHDKGKLSFSYDNPIDFKSMTKDNSIIEFYAIIGEKNAILENIKITLTDTEDSNNQITYYAFYQYNDGGAVYCRTQYLGKDLAEGGRNGNPWNAEYGKWATGSGFYYLTRNSSTLPWQEWSENNKVYPLTYFLDYEEKATYVQKRSGVSFEKLLILDLDKTSVIGSGAEWKGFANDTAYLSVDATFSNVDFEGGIVVKSLVGFNVGGVFTDDSSYPIPKVDVEIDSNYISKEDNKEILPDGYVGIKYKIPSVRAFDWYFADNQTVTHQIIKVDTSENCSAKEIEGYFVADESGEYKIVYTVNNSKNTVTKEYYFEVFENESPVLIGLESPFENAEIGNMFSIPKPVVYGGSKTITTTEKLYYNGKLVELDSTRKIFLDKAGDLTFSVESQCYGGSLFVKNFNVKVSDSIIMTVAGMPKIIKTGEDFQLPKAFAIDSFNGDQVNTTITFDGADVGEDRIVFTNKTEGKVKVVYKAVGISGEKVLEYELKVVNPETALPSDYFICADDSVQFDNRENGIDIKTNSSTLLSWGYPIVTGYASEKATIALYGLEGGNNFGYLDVILTDSEDRYSQTTIRMYNSSDGNTTIEVDGVKYETTGSFYNENGVSRVGFYIKNNAIYHSLNDKKICDLSLVNAKTCFISFKLCEINGNAGVSLFILGNQNMDLVYDGEWRDRIVPIISFDKKFDYVTEFSKGKTVTIPSMKAYDVFNASSSVTLKVLDPLGEVVYASKDLSKENSFTLDKIGRYSIVFSLSDNDKGTGVKTYYCDSLDFVNPVLTIEGSIKTDLEVGAKIIIPKATAVDDADGEIDVMIYVRYLKDNKIKHVDAEQEYVFDIIGQYEIVYVARDNSYNYATYKMPIMISEVANEQ